MSKFVQGMLARQQSDRQKKLDERADAEYQRQEDFRSGIGQLQKDFALGQGDFGASQQTSEVDQAVADASYDRVMERKGGIGLPVAQPDTQATVQAPVPPQMGLRTSQQIESVGGMPTTEARPGLTIPSASPEQGVSLSMDNANAARAATGRATMNPVDKERLLYRKMAELGTQYLPPEKAMAWQQGVKTMEKERYVEGMTNAFRGAVSGNRDALESLTKYYDGIDNGHNLDVSMARWDPKERAWVGVMNVYEDGTRAPTKLGVPELAQGFELLQPANMASSMMRREELALSKRRVEIEEKKATAEGTRADARLQFDREKLAAELESDKALGKYRMASLNVEQQKVGLQKLVLEKDENARDILNRQTFFLKSFDPGIKLDELSSPEDKAKVEAAKQDAALATSIYAMSAEGQKPSARSALAAETEQFMRGYQGKSLDPSKLSEGPDGTVRYGRLVIPSSMVRKAPDTVTTRTPRGLSTTGSY